MASLISPQGDLAGSPPTQPSPNPTQGGREEQLLSRSWISCAQTLQGAGAPK